MVKKLFASVVLILIMVVNVSAKDAVYINVQQTTEKMPEITTYVEVLDSNDLPAESTIHKDDITAYLNGRSLKIDSVNKFEDSGEGMACLFLVDISKSISNSQLDSIKTMMESWIDEMNPNDYAGIITFGESVNVLQEYTQSKETLYDVVFSIKITDNATKFYEGVDKGLLLSEQVDTQLPSRKILIAISDGEDMFAGGITKDELMNKVAVANTPIYGIGTHYGKISNDIQKYLDDFGAISRTSGGSYYQIGKINFEDVYNNIRNRLLSTYVLELKHSNNHITGEKAQLNIEIDIEGTVLKDEFEFIVDENIPDTVYPEILSSYYDEEGRVFQLEFSEYVIGADNIDNYIINGDNGLVLKPKAVVYDLIDGTYTSKLVLNEFQSGGKYSVTLKNIFDDSMEKNEVIANDIIFTVEIEEDIEPEKENSPLLLILIIGIVILLCILILIILVTKKKRKDNINNDKGDICINNELKSNKLKSSGVFARGKSIHFNVIDTYGDLRTYDLVIVNDITIGRSEDCDLSFNDEEMSRKHFSIKYENEVLLITDLGSVNGTYVNGIPVNGWLKLGDNDSILAGNIEMKINY